MSNLSTHNVLNIGFFYKDDLDLYGDTGNVEILLSRASRRSIDAQLHLIDQSTSLEEINSLNLNLVFMGGGPDSGQKNMYQDLKNVKGDFLKSYIEGGGVGLFVCGSYQLLGKYYKSADGSLLNGLGILDLFTENFGKKKPRCIGNVVCQINSTILGDPVFKEHNFIGYSLVGFENHGGRTFLSKNLSPFAKVKKGYGNNGVDSGEGVYYKNIIGTYLHGPILSKNPHIADWLIAKSLGLTKLPNLEHNFDSIILSAHTASKSLKQ